MKETHARQLAIHKATHGLDGVSPTGWQEEYVRLRTTFSYTRELPEMRSSRCPKCGTFHAGRCSQRDIENYRKKGGYR